MNSRVTADLSDELCRDFSAKTRCFQITAIMYMMNTDIFFFFVSSSSVFRENVGQTCDFSISFIASSIL